MNRILFVTVAALTCFPLSVLSAGLADGFYNEYFLGAKSGGPAFHEELAQSLKTTTKDTNLQVLCIRGPDSTVASGIKVNEYRKANPSPVIAPKCEGSGWVLVGPFPNIQKARERLVEDSGAMLHTIPSAILECRASVCSVVFE